MLITSSTSFGALGPCTSFYKSDNPNSPPCCLALTSHFKPRLSTFLTLQPLNTVPHVVGTSNHTLISLLLHNYSYATVMNCNINIYVFQFLGNLCERVVLLQRGCDPQVENDYSRGRAAW